MKKIALILVLVFGFALPAMAQNRPDSFADLAEQVSPAVVNIRTVKTVTRNLPDYFSFRGPGGQEFNEDNMPDMLRRFFGMPGGPGAPHDFKQRALGTGVIVDKEGYVLTNNHVIAGADEILAILKDGEEVPAEIVGRDPKTDLALIKLNIDKLPSGKQLPFLPLGDSDSIRVGDWVMAVGNPFGLTSTVTVGIVSAKGRNIGAGPYDDFIQTDASINPGNSGGPLVNLAGQVVGINTAIAAHGQGIGFAIPSSLAKSVMEQLRASGKVTRGWLGIYFQPLNKELAQQFNLEENQGVLVADVMADGPAAAAGLKRGDVIVKFDGKAITQSQTLPRMVAETKVGSQVVLDVLRQGKPLTIKLTIGAMPDEEAVASSPAAVKPDKNLGMSLQTVTPEIARQMGVDKAEGLLVGRVQPGSPADAAGILQGDIIMEVMQKPVNTVAEFNKLVGSLQNKQAVLLLVKRQNVTHYVVMQVE